MPPNGRSMMISLLRQGSRSWTLGAWQRCLSSSARSDLSGITVVSLEQAVAAPFLTCRLADDGARVIKVERPHQGDFARKYDKNARGGSSYFAWLNRGKESLALDLKSSADLDLLREIILKADVFVQNLAPGATERLGLASPELREMNPRLVTLDVSGYGLEGVYKKYKAYDMLITAEAGLCAVTGTKHGPGRVGVSICDITAGLNGYGAIMKGLYLREQTGKGSGYSVSLFDSIADIMNVPLIQQRYTGKPPQRVGLEHPSIAPYGAFETKDDRKVLISIQNEREWHLLCKEVLKNEQLASDERFCEPTLRVDNREALNEVIAECFKKHTAEEIKSLLLSASIAFGELNNVEGLMKHPILREVEYENEQGTPVVVAAPPIIDHDNPSHSYKGVPRLGQHSEQIRAEFAKEP